jgi:hypothetical protein
MLVAFTRNKTVAIHVLESGSREYLSLPPGELKASA